MIASASSLAGQFTGQQPTPNYSNDYHNFIRQKVQPSAVRSEVESGLQKTEGFSNLFQERFKSNTATIQSSSNADVNKTVQAAQEKAKNVQDSESQNINENTPKKRASLSKATPVSLIDSSKATGIPLHNSGVEILTKRPHGASAMSIQLDSRSLDVLSRVSERGEVTPRERPAHSRHNRTTNTTQAATSKYNPSELGGLSAQFESGGAGISAIGYDRVGGTSYGKYQIASRVGSFDQFVKYLEKKAPDIADMLKAGGASNTGSTSGKMPEIWRDIARNDSKRFGELQEGFIKESHFDPAFSALSGSGLNTNSMKLKQVVWSTAVQHGVGGARSIFENALNSISTTGKNSKKVDEKSFIEKVYDLRANQFGSSTAQVRQAVQNRLEIEKSLALR